MHPRTVERHPVLAALLRVEQRHFGILVQAQRRLYLGIPLGNAHAAGEVDLVGRHPERAGNGLPHLVHEHDQLFAPGLFVTGRHFVDQGKLVARQPGEAGRFRQQCFQTPGDALQQAVANLLAEAVVDHPETVDVDDHHRQPETRRGGSTTHRPVEAIGIERVVRQPGNDVVDRVRQHPLLRLPLLRGIAQDPGQAQAGLGGICQRPSFQLIPAIAAICMAQAKLLVEALAGPRTGGLQHRIEDRQVIGVQQIGPVLQRRLVQQVWPIAKQGRKLAADVERVVAGLIVPDDLFTAGQRQCVAVGLDRVRFRVQHAGKGKIGQYEGQRHQHQGQPADQHRRGHLAWRTGGGDIACSNCPQAKHHPDQK